MGMDLPYSVDELVEATKATVRVDRAAVVLHPPDRLLRLRRDGAQHAAVHGRRGHRLLAVGRLPGDDAVTKGVRMKISSWTRHDHNTMPPASKTTGNYVNSSLAKVEALKAGYDEAIMLAPNGLVAECTGENIFVSRNGIVFTPPLSAGALEGITQSSVMTIAARPRHRLPDRQHRPQRPVHRRGDLRLRHRRRDQLRQLRRRPGHPLPRAQDPGHRRRLRPRRPRRGAAVQGLVRARRLSGAARQSSAASARCSQTMSW